MHPRLIVVSGKMKGMLFALPESENTIGRVSTNTICLNDASVSRNHCVIRRSDDLFFACDLDSFNGTFVNGISIKEQAINHGDQLAIGDILMVFLIHQTDSEDVFLGEEESQLIIGDDLLNANQSTIRLERADAIYLNPENLLAALPRVERIANDLSTLLKISSAINSISDLNLLQKRLLELISEVIPSERATILLATRTDKEIVPDYVWTRNQNKNASVHLSRTVIDQCLRQAVSILSNSIGDDETLRNAESLVKANVHSVLCVPLVMFEKTFGVIYLDTSDVDAVFDQNHLQLLTGIAGIAVSPIENARQTEQLTEENLRLSELLEFNQKIIGESVEIKKIFSLISRVAPTDSTVLIRGESGTGKELAARAIHLNSARQNNPFIAINCATLTESLLESELFGHERGSFTGAVAQKKGQFELAHTGTIFLDEIGEIPLGLQAKLLRVLQEREIKRVGGTHTIKVDVRIIAATNRELEAAIKEGKFREDLYYRLNIITLTMPPLRSRREDVSLLVRFFINKYNEKCKRHIKGVSLEAKACLQDYEWVGNIRELENTIERAVVLAQTDTITLEDLPENLKDSFDSATSGDEDYQQAVLQAKRKIIEKAIAKNNGNLAETARSLGIHPNNFYRLMKTLNVRN